MLQNIKALLLHSQSERPHFFSFGCTGSEETFFARLFKDVSTDIRSNLLGTSRRFKISVGLRVVLFLTIALACAQDSPANENGYAQLTGSVFFPEPTNPFSPPRVSELKLPDISGARSVWGATGRDTRGHIWIGVSMSGSRTGAHLLEYDPGCDLWTNHGSVIDHLSRSDGIGQMKIHSKIVQASDGWLYFASMDEEGENAQSSTLPKNGGHLWRIFPGKKNWEHLFSVPEAIIAVSGVGRYIYALGYWDHVLFRYDTQTKQSRRITVGSSDGHVSRNFLADIRGHAFVPRIMKQVDGTCSAYLVEYDNQLNEIGETVLDYYLGKGSPEQNHGIVGIAYLPDHRMMFTTHLGQLYEITPNDSGPALVQAMGWIHPSGSVYAPGLYALGGNTWIGCITQRGQTFEWVVFDSANPTKPSQAFPIELGSLRSVLLYGSITTDDAGRIYAVGWASGGPRPLILQITPAH